MKNDRYDYMGKGYRIRRRRGNKKYTVPEQASEAKYFRRRKGETQWREVPTPEKRHSQEKKRR